MERSRATFVAFAAAGLLAGCAPDSIRPAPGYDQFLDTIAKKCFPQQLGQYLISDLIYGASPYFLDETSRLYFGKISQASYRNAMVSFSDNSAATNRGIDCILSYLPSAPPPLPGSTPYMAPGGQGNVPPPPPSR